MTWYQRAIDEAEARGQEVLVIVLPVSPEIFSESGVDPEEFRREATDTLMEWASRKLGL